MPELTSEKVNTMTCSREDTVTLKGPQDEDSTPSTTFSLHLLPSTLTTPSSQAEPRKAISVASEQRNSEKTKDNTVYSPAYKQHQNRSYPFRETSSRYRPPKVLASPSQSNQAWITPDSGNSISYKTNGAEFRASKRKLKSMLEDAAARAKCTRLASFPLDGSVQPSLCDLPSATTVDAENIMGNNGRMQEFTKRNSDGEGWTLNSITATGSLRVNYCNQDNGSTLLTWIGRLRGTQPAHLSFMYDSGASSNFTCDRFVQKHHLKLQQLDVDKRSTVKVADGSVYNISHSVRLPVSMGTHKTEILCLVVPMPLDVDVILGTPWVKDINEESDLSVNVKKSKLSFVRGGRKHVINCSNPLNTLRNLALKHDHFDIISATQAEKDLHFWSRQSNSKHDAFFISNMFVDKDKATCRSPSYLHDNPALSTALLQAMKKAEVKAHLLAAANKDTAESSVEKFYANVILHWNELVSKEQGKIKKNGSFEDHTAEDPDEVDDWPEVQHYREKLMNKFADVLAETLPPLSHHDHPPSRIRLQPGKESDPPFKKAYRMSSAELEALRKQLDELLEKGYIRPSASPYGAPVLMVPKPHQPGKLRLVIDYRGINQITVRDRYPLPHVDSLFDQLQGAKVFSTLDALWGFWQLPVASDDIEKTAMVTQFGSYEWIVLPMGLTNSPSTFQRVLSSYLLEDINEASKETEAEPAKVTKLTSWQALESTKLTSSSPTSTLPPTPRTKNHRMNEFVRVFIDDVLVFSKNEEDHYEHLIKVLARLRQVKFIMKGSKAQLFRRKVKFLGHVLTDKGVHPQHIKCKAVQDWPEPQNGQQVRQFLGLVGYYRKYIKDYADKARPLFDCLKGENFDNFKFTEEVKKSFLQLKESLVTPPLLLLPDQKQADNGNQPYLLVTDASQVAVGGVLLQDQGNGYQPVAYESKALSPAEQNYNTTERELLAIVHCTKVWKHYLQGSHYKLQSDHKPLEAFFSPNKDLTRRQARWIEHLVEVGVQNVEHVPGKTIPVPDSLSRRPGYEESSPAEGLKQQIQNQDFKLVQQVHSMLNTMHLASQLPKEVLSVFTRSHTRKDGLERSSPGSSDPLKTSTPQTLSDTRKDAAAQSQELSHSRKDAQAPQDDILNEHTSEFIKLTPRTSDETSNEELDPKSTKLTLSKGNELVHPDTSVEYPKVYNQSNRFPMDNQNWMLRPDLFEYWNKRSGPFHVDACSDEKGKNSHCASYWSRTTPPTLEKNRFKGKNWEYQGVLAQKADGKRLWINFPFNDPSQTAKGFRDKLFNWLNDARAHDPLTSALLIVPEWLVPTTAQLHRWNVEVLEVYPAGSHLFASPGQTTIPTQWDVYVLWMPPATSATSPIEDEPVTWVTMEGCDFIETLKAAQQEDTELRSIIQKIEEQDPAIRTSYKVEANLLWRVEEGIYQLVIPQNNRSLQQVVLSQCHDVPSAGHLGIQKTLERVSRHFFWKDMKKDVEHFCKHCHTCLSTKTANRVATAKKAIKQPYRKWEVITMDFVTGIPKTDRGYDAIVTFTDKLTKMVHLVPLHWKSSTAASVAKLFFDNVWRLHGCPLKIICDRDTRMASQTWKELMKLVGVSTAATTPYRPQADGQSEVTNKIMEQILRAYIEPRQKNWDLLLAAVEFAMNDSVHSVTQFSPFYLNYGQSPASNLDVLLGTLKRESSAANPTAIEIIDAMETDLREAKRHVTKYWDKLKARNSTNKHQPHYKIGDQVMLSSSSFTAPKDKDTQWKLRPKYYGPFSIVKVYYDDENYAKPEEERGSPSACKLGLPKGWYIHPVFSLDKLKPFPGFSQYEHQNSLPPPPTQIVEGQEEFVVDRILDHCVMRTRGSKKKEMHWLVRWKGYGPEEDLWLKERNINAGGINAIWRAYENKRKRRFERQNPEEADDDNEELHQVNFMEECPYLEATLSQLTQKVKEYCYSLTQPCFNLEETAMPPRSHYFFLTSSSSSSTVAPVRKAKTSVPLTHFMLNMSSDSATVRDLTISRPQDFVVTVFHYDSKACNAKPSENFDYIVDLPLWTQPQLESSIHQFAPHYFDFCWFKVIDPMEIKSVNLVLPILKPKYWTILDCTPEGIPTEKLSDEEWTTHGTPQSTEGCLRIITTVPLGKRCAAKLTASNTITSKVEVILTEYFTVHKNFKPSQELLEDNKEKLVS